MKKEPTPARIGSELTLILTYYNELADDAPYKAADPEFPGGEAMNLLGPAANLEAWQHQYEAIEAQDKDAAYVNDQLETEAHPLLVLPDWEDKIRDIKGQPTDLQATVKRSADYLRNNIDWMFAEPYPELARMYSELKAVRSNLETVLKAGERAERTRVTCINDDCEEKPRLVKKYSGDVDNPRPPADDFWSCPACSTRYSGDEFRRATAVHMHSEATGEAWVTVADAAHSIGRSAWTVRSWATRDEKVSTQIVGTSPSTMWVLWSDVRNAHRDSIIRELKRKARKSAA